jgi:hypothetical protein
MGLWPTQVDKKRPLFSNFILWKRYSSLCHLDRSAAKWRDLCVDALSWECFSTERTRISYFALRATATYAAFFKERRMELINATTLKRKYGGAQWRDLRSFRRVTALASQHTNDRASYYELTTPASSSFLPSRLTTHQTGTILEVASGLWRDGGRKS